MIDAIGGAVVLGAGLLVGAAGPLAGQRAPRFARVDQGGASVLLGAGVQHAAYGVLEPLGRGLARAGLTADVVTLSSVPFAAASAWAVGANHLGVGALFAGLSFACDALDGVIARATGTASDAGEVLDAACDRICEALMLGGVAFAWRGSGWLLAIALAAALGAQQVTLATAKAETFPAERDRVPRGVMRRAERAAYFVGAAAISGVLLDLLPARSVDLARLPLVASLALLAVAGNVSALGRFAALARALRARHDGGPRAGA